MSGEDVTSNVVPLRPAAAKTRNEKKWSKPVMDCCGFCIVPSVLLRAQARLGLSATQLLLVIHLIDFWWSEEEVPWPKKETLGERMSLSDKQVQRLVRALEQRGYVQRVVRTTRHGRTSNGYDLAGLVSRLKELAPEFAAAAKAKREVERRGGRLKKRARPASASRAS